MPLSTLGRLAVGGRLWAIGSMIGAGLGGIKCGKGFFDEDGEELMFKLERPEIKCGRDVFDEDEIDVLDDPIVM